MSQLICSEPGASSIFPGSLVSYSNDIKHRLLQVKESTLTNHGAVSSVAAREMALGALKNFSTDYCLALSGIAGPTGGSKEKPVGTLFIAWGTINQIKVKEFHLTYSRTEFQTMAAFIAMDLLRRDIQGIKTTPLYFQRFKPKD